MNLPASFLLLFLGLKLAEFVTNLSVERYRSFHPRYVVPDPQTVHDFTIHVMALVSAAFIP